MKNSSRFEETIARNFTRSSSGTSGSSANWSTRSLNSIHEASRLKYRLRSARSGGSLAVSSGGAEVTSVTTANHRTPGHQLVNELLHACQIEQDSLTKPSSPDL